MEPLILAFVVHVYRSILPAQLERQMQMQLQLRQRMVATQLAMTRERMYWWAGFATLAAIGLTAG